MSKDQKTVYLLHGWAIDPKNEQKWATLRNSLQKQRIQSVFIPIPGLDTPLENPWSLDDYVVWLEATLPDKPVILLGHSFGGQLAVRFTARYKERIEKLILVDSSGIIDRSLKKAIKRSVFKFAAKIGGFLGQVPYARAFLYKLARERDYYSAPPVMRETMSRVLDDEILDDIAQVDSETLIIWGEHDRATPLSNTQQLLNIPKSKLHIISQARHSPQFTHPEPVAKLVAEFIEE